MSALTHARLVEVLHYCPKSGVFTWRVNKGGRAKAGQSAARANAGSRYPRIRIDRAFYFAHRLAWFYVTGAPPAFEIDHVNGDRNDFRFSNLRDVPRGVNQQNQTRPYSNNKLGVQGVFMTRGKFGAAIGVDGGTKFLGTYESSDAAQAVYLEAKRQLHEGNTL